MKNSYSSLKVFYHRDILESIENGTPVSPVYVRLKPTNVCNHHCAYCTYGSGDTRQRNANRDSVDARDTIPWEKLEAILTDMGELGVKAVTFSGGGEPLTYPRIRDAVAVLRQYDVDTSLITNGQLLSGENAEAFYDAKWVRISFDSPDEKIYCSLRNVPAEAFQTVCANIKSFSENKAENCVLGINFVVSEANHKCVYDAAGLLKNLGADNIKFAAVVSETKGYHAGIKDEVISQIHRAIIDFSDNSFQVINNYENDWMDKNFSTQPFGHCYTCRLVTAIGADQKVYLCHTRAYDSGAVVGDLKEQSFRDIWTSPATVKKLSEFDPRKECRNFCAYQERNELINAYFDVNIDHINFI